MAGGVSELPVSVNTQSVDPIYWGSFGPDVGAITTAANGRVCFHEFRKWYS